MLKFYKVKILNSIKCKPNKVNIALYNENNLLVFYDPVQNFYCFYVIIF